MCAKIAEIDPQQEIFSRVKIDLEEQGKAVFDGFLPPKGTEYPFVYLGNCQQTDSGTKNAVHGKVYLTIHVWHNDPHKRGTVSKMLAEIKAACRAITRTDNFAWSVRNDAVTSNIIPDNTTNPPLLHGYVNVEWAFS